MSESSVSGSPHVSSRRWKRLVPGWEGGAYLLLVAVALGMHLWGLGGRAIHYDEAIHAYYAFQLAEKWEYTHAAWNHGPFLYHMSAFVYKLFGASEFTARLAFALFGVALVGLPYFFRRYLGRWGALATAMLLAFSPSLLYYGRFVRNDIYIAFWTLALFILAWRYFREGRDRYLYISSAVLALAFATKETAFIMMGLFGIVFGLMALPQVISWVRYRTRFRDMAGPAGFIILMATLTLPQWTPLVSYFQEPLGLTLVNSSGPMGPVGMPLGGGPFISLPLVLIPSVVNWLIIAAMVGIGIGLSAYLMMRKPRSYLPVSMYPYSAYLDLSGLIKRNRTVNVIRVMLATSLVVLAYVIVTMLDIDAPVNYVVAVALVVAAVAASIYIGLMWRGLVWCGCAAIFYFIWIALFTTVGRNPVGGFVSGMWESMGYWLAQQDVSRGDQPWYFYFTMALNYEFLPFLLAVPAFIYYTVKEDRLGMVLGLLSLFTLAFYIFAGEKMAWLIVEVVLPFLVLAGKFLGDIFLEVMALLAPRLRATSLTEAAVKPFRTWLRGAKALSGPVLLWLLVPVLVALGGWLLVRYLGTGVVDVTSWTLIGVVSFVGLLVVWLGWRARWPVASRLATLGMAVLLLGFGIFVGGRASYTYDDNPVEILVYAQGSFEMREVADQVREEMAGQPDGSEVAVDYELWYPYQWYARHDDFVRFYCYKEQSEDGWVSWCKPIEETPKAAMMLLNTDHGERDSKHLEEKYERTGKHRNLMWFPQIYRVSEIQSKDGFLTRRSKEIRYLWSNMQRREAWNGFFQYLINRSLGSDWWYSDFYAYFPKEG